MVSESSLTEPIRIARIVTRLNVGGPATHVMLLAARLCPLGYETRLIAGRPGVSEGNMETLRPVHGVSPRIVPSLGRELGLRDVSAFVDLIGVLRSFRPLIVHTHLSKAGALGRLAARAARVPVVVHTFHGNVLSGYFDPVRTGAFLRVERALARITDKVVAISPGQADEIATRGIARGDKVAVIPLGLDLTPFLGAVPGRLRAELDVGPDVPIIALVARLVPIKGVDLFLGAAARVVRSGRKAVFVVIGDGEERVRLEAEVRTRGLATAVRFLGWRADLPGIYADADVVALTSHNEGMPVSLIEALAAGRAVVGTSVGGVPELLGGSTRGLLVPPGDEARFAQAIVRLLDEPSLRASLGRAGHDYVFPEFDIATLVGRMDALYRGLLKGR